MSKVKELCERVDMIPTEFDSPTVTMLKTERLTLTKIIRLQHEALETSKKHCVCKRNTYGFDYREDHKYLGNPKPGARWLTPFDIITQTLEETNEISEKTLNREKNKS